MQPQAPIDLIKLKNFTLTAPQRWRNAGPNGCQSGTLPGHCTHSDIKGDITKNIPATKQHSETTTDTPYLMRQEVATAEETAQKCKHTAVKTASTALTEATTTLNDNYDRFFRDILELNCQHKHKIKIPTDTLEQLFDKAQLIETARQDGALKFQLKSAPTNNDVATKVLEHLDKKFNPSIAKLAEQSKKVMDCRTALLALTQNAANKTPDETVTADEVNAINNAKQALQGAVQQLKDDKEAHHNILGKLHEFHQPNISATSDIQSQRSTLIQTNLDSDEELAEKKMKMLSQWDDRYWFECMRPSQLRDKCKNAFNMIAFGGSLDNNVFHTQSGKHSGDLDAHGGTGQIEIFTIDYEQGEGRHEQLDISKLSKNEILSVLEECAKPPISAQVTLWSEKSKSWAGKDTWLGKMPLVSTLFNAVRETTITEHDTLCFRVTGDRKTMQAVKRKFTDAINQAENRNTVEVDTNTQSTENVAANLNSN